MKEKKDIMQEVAKDQPCSHGDGYCIFKEMILHDSKYSARALIQTYCVNRFKYEQSQQAQKDVGWDAWKAWSELGHAERFAEFFSEDMPLNELYSKVTSGSPDKT